MGTEMSENENNVVSMEEKEGNVYSSSLGHEDAGDVLSNGIEHDASSNGVGRESDVLAEDVDESYVFVGVDEASLDVSKAESLPRDCLDDSNGLAAAEIQLNGVEDVKPELETEVYVELEINGGDSHLAEIHDSKQLNGKSLDHLDSTPAEIEENGAKNDYALSVPATDQPAYSVEDAGLKTSLVELNEVSLDHQDSTLAEIEENGANTDHALTSPEDESPETSLEESDELKSNYQDSNPAEIEENGATDQPSCGVEDESPETSLEELNEVKPKYEDSIPAEIEENSAADQPSCGLEDESPETSLEESNEVKPNYQDSNPGEIKENGAADQPSCGLEDESPETSLEESNEVKPDYQDSNPAEILENGAADQPSCGLEDESPDTSLEESNEVKPDYQDSNLVEIKENGAKIKHALTSPETDQTSCGIEDTSPETTFEELDAKSLIHHDSDLAEIEENGATADDALSLPTTDHPTGGIEDASLETGSEELNGKRLEHHDSYPAGIKENGFETQDAVPVATEDQLSNGVEGACLEAGPKGKSLNQYVETDDVVSLSTTDQHSSAVEVASQDSDEKCRGHTDTYQAEVEETNDATVSLPPSDLPSCVVEDVTNRDSCPAEIENDAESPKTGQEESNVIPAEIEESDATSEPETSSGGPIANVSTNEANVGPNVNTSVDHGISSPDSPVDDDVNKACNDQTSSREDVEPAACQAGTIEGQSAGVDVAENPPFYYLIRIPRCDDDTLREEIKLAEGQVLEKTKARDAIRLKIQPQRERAKEYLDKVQAMVAAERAARDVLKSKRLEVDSVQSVINKLKSALSVEDIGATIRNMEHMIQHETMPLKEEKQLIREIKQLKQQREQICSTLGNQDEIQQTINCKDQVEEQLKGLKKELDSLRVLLAKAEEATQAAKQESNKENEKLNELLYLFKNADGVRQEAYAHFHSLKKQQYEKNKYFWSYKDASKEAEKLALSGDKEHLQRLCVEQVDRVMELWNRDDTFRREYVRRNMRSTLRRLRTLDGRAPGPDEVLPVIPGRVAPSAPIPKQEKETVSVKAEKADGDDEKLVLVVKKSTMAATETVLTEVKAEDKANDEAEMRARKEEEEKMVLKAAEEKTKAEEAVRLKEQAKLEEKVKAKEAMERKKRNAERVQARAAVRAQKEAEEKEKEREKRARKKERKKANGGLDAEAEAGDGQNAAIDNADASGSASNAPNTEAINETVTPVKSRTRATVVHKVKTKAVMPAPLRNRSKRRKQWWMLPLALAILLLFVLFFFFKPHLLI